MADKLKISTLSVHADDGMGKTTDIAAPLHVSTTYSYKDPSQLVPFHEEREAADEPVYSRYNPPVIARAEKVLSEILDGHAIAYASGLSAFHAAMIYYNPKNVFIGHAYHGCKAILHILTRNYGVKVHDLDADPQLLQAGDVMHLESPVNPFGTAIDIAKYVEIAHSRGAFVIIDSTFAPPPMQYPFDFGVDMILHSATKYFGGHSDLLAGVLVTKSDEVKDALLADRAYLGSVTASMESWLLLRSLRSYEVRVRKQVSNAVRMVKYFNDNIADFPALTKVYHASLQTEPFVKKQLPLDGGPVFSITVKDESVARQLPSKLKLFHHATSLGGVESLIEWRTMSDHSAPRDLLRVSIGVEDAEDLIQDLVQALKQF